MYLKTADIWARRLMHFEMDDVFVDSIWERCPPSRDGPMRESLFKGIIWLWVKNAYPKWNPGRWNQRLKPAVPWWLYFDQYPFLLLWAVFEKTIRASRFSCSVGTLHSCDQACPQGTLQWQHASKPEVERSKPSEDTLSTTAQSLLKSWKELKTQVALKHTRTCFQY